MVWLEVGGGAEDAAESEGEDYAECEVMLRMEVMASVR